MTTSKQVIHAKALELLEQAPNGLRYGALHAALVKALPEIPPNTIHGNIWNLETNFPEKVLKPARGLFLDAKYHDGSTQEAITIEPPKAEKVKEEKWSPPRHRDQRVGSDPGAHVRVRSLSGRRYIHRVERIIRKFASHEEADEADRAAMSALSPQERLEQALTLQARYREAHGDAGQGLARVARVVPFSRS